MSVEGHKNIVRHDQEIYRRIDLKRLTKAVSEDQLPPNIIWQGPGTLGEEVGPNLLQQLEIPEM